MIGHATYHALYTINATRFPYEKNVTNRFGGWWMFVKSNFRNCTTHSEKQIINFPFTESQGEKYGKWCQLKLRVHIVERGML